MPKKTPEAQKPESTDAKPKRARAPKVDLSAPKPVPLSLDGAMDTAEPPPVPAAEPEPRVEVIAEDDAVRTAAENRIREQRPIPDPADDDYVARFGILDNVDEAHRRKGLFDFSREKRATLNFTVSDDFKVEFGVWCKRHRLSQVAALVEALKLLKIKYGE